MGRTACTEPQCLYKGALYLYLYLILYYWSEHEPLNSKYSLISLSLLRQVHSFCQRECVTHYDIVLTLSISRALSFP